MYLVNNMMALALQKALFGVLYWSESQKLSVLVYSHVHVV